MPKAKKSKFKKFRPFTTRKPGLLAFVLIFAAIGGYFIYKSFAATTGRVAVNKPAVSILSSGTNSKYWIVTQDGGVFSMGGATFHGSMGGKALNQSITSAAVRPAYDGYWMLGGDGGVYSFGGAAYHGRPASQSDLGYYRAIVSTPSGNGYWIVSKYGQIFAYGDAATLSSTSSSGWTSINASITKNNTALGCCLNGLPTGGIVAASRSSTGRGLVLLSSNGGVYAYGDAAYRGGLTGMGSGETAEAIKASGAGSTGGYIAVSSKGRVATYNVANHGSPINLSLAGKIVDLAFTPGGKGYWMLGQDGGIFGYGDAQYSGSVIAPTPSPQPAPTSTTNTGGSTGNSSPTTTQNSPSTFTEHADLNSLPGSGGAPSCTNIVNDFENAYNVYFSLHNTMQSLSKAGTSTNYNVTKAMNDYGNRLFSDLAGMQQAKDDCKANPQQAYIDKYNIYKQSFYPRAWDFGKYLIGWSSMIKASNFLGSGAH